MKEVGSMIRYSLRNVIVGRIGNIDIDKMNKYKDRIAVIIPEQERSLTCVIDLIKREAIDIFEPENRYPFFGKEEDDFIVRQEPIEENKQYVLKVEKPFISYRDERKMLKQLQKKGVI